MVVKSITKALAVSPAAYAFEPADTGCRLCETATGFVHCGSERFLQTGQELRLCKQCGLASLFPNFTDEALAKFYAQDYRHVSLIDAAHEHDDRFFEQTKYREFAQRRIALLQDRIPKAGKILEIGSGFGGFLGALHAMRPDLTLHATEADTRHRSALLGKAPVRFLEDAELAESGPYDAIVLFHVLEHLKHPVARLKQLKTLLKPDAPLVIEVPDALAPWGNWLYVQPAHLSYFTSASLRRCMQHAGIAVESLGTHPGGTAFAEHLWAIGQARASETIKPLPANADEIAAFSAHIAQYRWDFRQALRHRLRALFLAGLGSAVAGRLARWRYARRMQACFEPRL